MKKLIVVADWAADSVNCQEIRTAVEGNLKDPSNPNITFVASTPSSIHTAFIVQQLTEIENRYGRPGDTVLFQNTDPRLQTKEGVEKAKGADFIVVRLQTGMYICGPNAGYDFSLIKPLIEEVFVYQQLDKGSQFRSRDLYARVCAHLMDSMEDDMDLVEADPGIIPDLKGAYIAHIDSYGNMKTTMTGEDLKGKVEIGEEIDITINGVTKKVTYTHNLFGAGVGKLVIYPGSS
ncbi:SAM-dependent chlorinase/fluorinase, partial [Candidatus Microgenomates bacterium]|nr:SAM-dependent chlorinase/fluorinase [Candidatus Microgenomates bacterium]